jgi:hypothetical protein
LGKAAFLVKTAEQIPPLFQRGDQGRARSAGIGLDNHYISRGQGVIEPFRVSENLPLDATFHLNTVRAGTGLFVRLEPDGKHIA